MTKQAPFRWTLRRALAAAALALGVIALAGDPGRGHVVTLDTRELAGIVDAQVDHVRATDLADWIVQNRSDYRLVDLRTPAEFAAYHVPTSENVPLAELMDAGLARNERIVLISDGGIHAAQAWMLMRAERYPNVRMVLGGLEAWRDSVLYPVAPADSTPRARATFERAAQVARFFGGGPRAASPADEPTLAALPEAPMPAAVAPASGGARKPPVPAKKKKEGC